MDNLINSHTCLGTADDVVLQYPWNIETQIGSLEDQLISSAIYNQTLAINDGYLIANKNLLPSVLDTSRSLLGNLLESHTAVMFSRSEPKSIATGIEKNSKNIETNTALNTASVSKLLCDKKPYGDN